MKYLAQAFTCVAILCSSPALSDSLGDIYNLAVDNDPELRAAHAAYLGGQESRNIGRAGLLPHLSAGATYQESRQDVDASQDFGPIQSTRDGRTRGDTTRFEVSLNQPLFNLPAWYDFKQGRTVSEQARVRFAADQQNLISRVAEAYFNVLRARENLNTAIAEQEALGRQLDQTRQRYDVGLVAITEVHEAQAAYDDAAVNTLELRGTLNIAFEGLEVLTGRPHRQLAGLKENFPVRNPEPATREEWVDFSLANNLELEVAQLVTEASRHNADARKSEHLPTLSGSLSYEDVDSDSRFRGLQSDQDETLQSRNIPSERRDQGYVAAIHLEVPLFTGGLVSAERRRAYQEYVQAGENLVATRRNITQQARSAHQQMVTDAARVKARKQAITSADSALEATRAGYQVGTRNIVDVLLAERSLFQARRNYANARYDYIGSSLELKRVAGQLSPEDVRQLDAWLDPGLAIEPATGAQ